METLIVIFVNSLSKGFSWPNMKKFDFSVLTANSSHLQSAALNIAIDSGQNFKFIMKKLADIVPDIKE